MVEKNEAGYNFETDLNMNTVRHYFELGRLGKLSSNLGGFSSVEIALDKLYVHATGLELFGYDLEPENILATCLYGSLLYKHFPVVTEVTRIEHRRFGWFGEKRVDERTVVKPPRIRDVDVMIITKHSLSDDKVVKSTRVEHTGLYGYVEHISSDGKSGVFIKSRHLYNINIPVDLHITYRSVEQIVNGVNNGDELSESITRYGLPIFGQSNFFGLMNIVDFPKDNRLHRILWKENSEGRLNGELVEMSIDDNILRPNFEEKTLLQIAEQRYFIGTIKEHARHGWFFGHFMDEELLRSENVEVARMKLSLTDEAPPHYHLQSTEITIVMKGRLHVLINGESRYVNEGEFLVIPPGTILQNTDNTEGTEVCVVKFPSIKGDKYFV